MLELSSQHALQTLVRGRGLGRQREVVSSGRTPPGRRTPELQVHQERQHLRHQPRYERKTLKSVQVRLYSLLGKSQRSKVKDDVAMVQADDTDHEYVII